MAAFYLPLGIAVPFLLENAVVTASDFDCHRSCGAATLRSSFYILLVKHTFLKQKHLECAVKPVCAVGNFLSDTNTLLYQFYAINK